VSQPLPQELLFSHDTTAAAAAAADDDDDVDNNDKFDDDAVNSKRHEHCQHMQTLLKYI